MLMTPLGGRGVGPAWQQESLMLVLKIPKLHICSSGVAMCQLKLTGRSSGIQQTPSASPKKTRKVLCLSPIFLVYG